MTPVEIKFLIWSCTALLGVISFVGIIFVNSFLKMAKDIAEIKTIIAVQASKHEDLEKRVENLEELTIVRE